MTGTVTAPAANMNPTATIKAPIWGIEARPAWTRPTAAVKSEAGQAAAVLPDKANKTEQTGG